jgi:hypothetical protein
MIKLSENRTQLMNMKTTIDALDEFDTLIKYYSVDKPGPAYCKFSYVDGIGECSVQIDRSIVVPTLQAQRQKLVDYLATLGIEA